MTQHEHGDGETVATDSPRNGANLEALERETKAFFDLHWSERLGERPAWSAPWNFRGTIPGGEHAGCYALVGNDGTIEYVGLGASVGNARYPEFGIGWRLKRIWRMDPASDDPLATRRYLPTPKYTWVREVRTLGLPGAFYLAAALEAYLVWKLMPPRNVIGRGRAART
jgi:hypothetical protein